MPMPASTINRVILDWAMGNNYGFRVCRVAGLPNHCLRIKLNHATVDFHNGQLVRMVAHDKGKRSGQLAMEMASLFALCGIIKSRNQSAAGSVRKLDTGVADQFDSAEGDVVAGRLGQSGISSVKSLMNTTASMANPNNVPLSSKMALPTSENASRINNMPDSLRRDLGLKDFGKNTDFGW